MKVIYKVDVLAELKKAGYNSTVILKDNLIPQGSVQRLRHGEPVSFETLSKLCHLLKCQPGDLLEYIEEQK